jgi:hypothetical protein
MEKLEIKVPNYYPQFKIVSKQAGDLYDEEKSVKQMADALSQLPTELYVKTERQIILNFLEKSCGLFQLNQIKKIGEDFGFNNPDFKKYIIEVIKKKEGELKD